jgi:hypothetical protein
MTDIPVVHIPVSPVEELDLGFDDLTSATVGAKVDLELDVLYLIWAGRRSY